MLQHKTIEKLCGHSLFIGEKPLFPETHVAYPSGCVVSKSAEIVGNGHESSESFLLMLVEKRSNLIPHLYSFGM